jgi:D-alanyl-D-alanine carboxypeptidase
MLNGMQRSRSLVFALLLLPALLAACGEGRQEVESTVVARSPVPGEQTPAPMASTEASDPDGAVVAASSADPVPVSPTPTPNADGVYIVACGDIHVPLDKLHRLEEDCEPAGLVELSGDYAFDQQRVTEAVLPDLLALLGAAAAEGHRLAVVSSYRSFETQRNTYQYHVDTYGPEQASRVSARPGHSEHQLGTTVDFSSASVGHELVEAFGATPEGRWLADHAHDYGFILSYPEGMEDVTGYSYEPWHFRWVGRETAAEVRASGLTLGQFLLR